LGYLTAFLNSSIFKFAFKEYFPELLGETRELRKVFFETVAVKTVDDESWYEKKVELIIDRKNKGLPTYELESEIDEHLFTLYELSQENIALIRSLSVN
jgi:hypothetical protein